MHFAAYNGNLEIIRLLAHHGGDITVENNMKINCLHFAAQGNQPKVLNYLLKNHCSRFDVSQSDAHGYTPLHWACISGSYQAVRYLLAAKADPNIPSSDSSTPLHVSLKNMDETREPRIIHKLLIYGSLKNVNNNKGETCESFINQIEDEDLKGQC